MSDGFSPLARLTTALVDGYGSYTPPSFFRRKSGSHISDLSLVGSESSGDVSSAHEYDYVIIGGGTSGCVLASRLSEDPSVRVLLLEAGGSGVSLPFTTIPSGFSKLFRNPKHVFQLYTETQQSVSGRKLFWPRAKLLGGCSSINAEMAQFGAPQDFDEWARLTGDDSWSFKNFKQYFDKFETSTPNPDCTEPDESTRGNSGPVKVGYSSYSSETGKAFVKAAENLGVPTNWDFNGGKTCIGVGRMMSYIDNKYKRSSSESAYLTPEVLARPNLKVAINATVTRILFDEKSKEPQATGVEFSRSAEGKRYVAKAKREVILSAGAIHSPQILLLSGIGAKEDLAALEIPIIKDLPNVGRSLIDHPVVDLFFQTAPDYPTLKYLNPRTTKEVFEMLKAFWMYQVRGQGGPLTCNIGEAAAFIRSTDPKLFPPEEYTEQLEDTMSGEQSPDLELFASPVAYKDHGLKMFDVHTYALHVCLLRPKSQGSVKLKSSSPWDLPSADPRYLTEPVDIQRLIRGVRILLKLSQTSPLSPHFSFSKDTSTEDDHQLQQKTDEELTELIKERIETLYHPASTCRMSTSETEGVVDSKLRVHGMRNLRVCDASVFPKIVSGHTAGTCFALGEKLADELKAKT